MTGTSPGSPKVAASPPIGAHVVLVGLPGSGKSTIGPELARRLGRTFVDFDTEIERRERRSISEIFAADGEPFFRGLERLLTGELARQPAAVVGPGGGWITGAGNVATLRPPARLVYLRVSPAVAVVRMGESVAARPLLNRHDPVGDLHRLYVERDPLYMNADMFVNTEVLDISEVIELIADYVATVEIAGISRER